MSWYATDLVTCGKCGERFSTPIECHSHWRNGCNITRTVYTNGSVSKRDDTTGEGYIKARPKHSPKFWIAKLGFYADLVLVRIVREGREWKLEQDTEGWHWV